MSGRVLLIVFMLLTIGLYARVKTAPAERAVVSTRQPLNEVSRQPAGSEVRSRSPIELNRVPLEIPSRDPFAFMIPSLPVEASKPRAAVPKSMETPPTPPTPPPPPTPPALNLTFVGSMIDPDGNRSVIAATGSTTVTLRKGLVLQNGWHVESFEEGGVVFRYPPSNAMARLDIPSPPRLAVQ